MLNLKCGVTVNIKNIIAISDLHGGCQFGLCPPAGALIEGGGRYFPSPIQLKLWGYWLIFWSDWVPMVTRGEPYDLVINGDSMDGNHHSSTHQITHNPSDQAKIAYEVLSPVVEKARKLYMVKGTETHVGASGEAEERLAERLGAVPDEHGQYARYDLWKEVGQGSLVHFLHHIGTTSSNAYEGTAVNKELTEEFNEAARWGNQPPDVIIRSHRHRAYKITLPTKTGEAIAQVTPGWQAKTPFTWRIAGARLAPPQFGGVLIRSGDEDPIYTRAKVWTIGRTEIERN